MYGTVVERQAGVPDRPAGNPGSAPSLCITLGNLLNLSEPVLRIKNKACEVLGI